MIGAALAGAALDPERLLWVPGKKVISIPTVAKPDTLSAEMLEVLHRNTIQMRLTERCFEDLFNQSLKTFNGRSQLSANITLRKPPRFQTGAIL